MSRVYEEEHHAAVQQLTMMSHKLVVMTETMRATLDSFHAAPPHRYAVIPHGVPALALNRTQGTPHQTIFPGRLVIMSNGLLHSGKGIEYMINAMPAIVEKFPDALYVVQGKPHPTGWKVKEYYERLHKDVQDLNLDDHVYFLEEFVSTPDLIDLLRGVHIYVNPYVDHTQSVSGTLAMALSTGACVVSTPYPYAEELLRKRDLGVLVPVSGWEWGSGGVGERARAQAGSCGCLRRLIPPVCAAGSRPCPPPHHTRPASVNITPASNPTDRITRRHVKGERGSVCSRSARASHPILPPPAPPSFPEGLTPRARFSLRSHQPLPFPPHTVLQFRDSGALSAAVIRLFSNPALLTAYNTKAHAAAADMTWARVGARYLELAKLM